MATYVVYGDAGFTSARLRDNAATQVRGYFTARPAFTAASVFGFPAGVVNGTVMGRNGFTVCYTTQDVAAAETAERAAYDVFAQFDYEGSFGWQHLSDS
jgi:hypothetical protein